MPDEFDIHEWEIMRKFAGEQTDKQARVGLLNAIYGATRLSSFQERHSHARYREALVPVSPESLEEIARDWLEEHKLPYKMNDVV
ncbi:MAG TPA: hypothetical protein VKY85_25280 [Candidatus Angelobacter sp.]|nr:hypothetical protein [Candidatus Angelobacter sp.]